MNYSKSSTSESHGKGSVTGGGTSGQGPVHRLSSVSNRSRPNYNLPMGRWLDESDEKVQRSNRPSPLHEEYEEEYPPTNDGDEEFEQSESSNSSSLHYTRPKTKKNRLNSPVGNYNYVCPEIVLGEEYDHTVDWWAVAVLCFHFLAGITPFEDIENNNSKVTMDNIFLHRAKWNLLPENNISNECKSFISSIISVQNVNERLGYESSQQILEHPFFYDIDFNTLYEEKGPLLPHLSNQPLQGKDTSPKGAADNSSHRKSTSTNVNNSTSMNSSLTVSAGGTLQISTSGASSPTAGHRKRGNSNASSHPSSQGSNSSTNTTLTPDVPVFTLLSKDEIFHVPSFGSPKEESESNLLQKKRGRNSPSPPPSSIADNNKSASSQVLDVLNAYDYSTFTYYG
jgi:hypothetical protein